MPSQSPMSLLKYVLPVSAAVIFAAGSLSAQSDRFSAPSIASASSSESSSAAQPVRVAAADVPPALVAGEVAHHYIGDAVAAVKIAVLRRLGIGEA